MERFFVAGEGADAAVLWRPEICSHVLRLVSVPATQDASRAGLRLDDLLALPNLVAAIADDRHHHDGGGDHHHDLHVHLLYRQGGRQLQIEIAGAAMMGGTPLLLVLPAIMDRGVLQQQLDALRAFDALRRLGALPAWYDRTAARNNRLAFVCTALDLWLAGQSQRETAVALFGRARVERDWGDPGEHCRDQVRRAIARGRWLMGGGYRWLLA